MKNPASLKWSMIVMKTTKKKFFLTIMKFEKPCERNFYRLQLLFTSVHKVSGHDVLTDPIHYQMTRKREGKTTRQIYKRLLNSPGYIKMQMILTNLPWLPICGLNFHSFQIPFLLVFLKNVPVNMFVHSQFKRLRVYMAF